MSNVRVAGHCFDDSLHDPTCSAMKTDGTPCNIAFSAIEHCDETHVAAQALNFAHTAHITATELEEIRAFKLAREERRARIWAAVHGVCSSR